MIEHVSRRRNKSAPSRGPPSSQSTPIVRQLQRSPGWHYSDLSAAETPGSGGARSLARPGRPEPPQRRRTDSAAAAPVAFWPVATAAATTAAATKTAPSRRTTGRSAPRPTTARAARRSAGEVSLPSRCAPRLFVPPPPPRFISPSFESFLHPFLCPLRLSYCSPYLPASLILAFFQPRTL